jgi:ABC-type ribose transport system, auxiliary component
MKKGIVLNSEIVSVMARLGHGDSLCIADSGLPVPEGRKRIDIALRSGMPGFADTLRTVLEELCVERVLLAEEIRTNNPDQYQAIEKIFEEYRTKNGQKVPVDFTPQTDFKKATASCAAIIRTGECSPYSNIILYSGVIF